MPNRTAIKAAAKSALVRLASGVLPEARGLRCLMYHSVVANEEYDSSQMTVSAGLLAAHLEYLQDTGRTVLDAGVAVEELIKNPDSDPSAVVLTFDDGFEDNYLLALPVLERFKSPATVFVVADALVGRSRPISGAAYFDVGQAREMLATGLIRFGCHSATHRSLRGLPAGELRRETIDAKCRIEDALGTSVSLFAYPFGARDAWDERVLLAVRTAGFDAAFTSIVGPNRAGSNRFLLSRVRISWFESPPMFARLLEGGYDWYAGMQWLYARYALLRAPRSTTSIPAPSAAPDSASQPTV